MFGKLKNKLKEWTKKVSDVEETEEEVLEEIPFENKKTKSNSSSSGRAEKTARLGDEEGEEKSLDYIVSLIDIEELKCQLKEKLRNVYKRKAAEDTI